MKFVFAVLLQTFQWVFPECVPSGQGQSSSSQEDMKDPLCSDFSALLFHFLPPTSVLVIGHFEILRAQPDFSAFMFFPSTPLPARNPSTWGCSIHLPRSSSTSPLME